MSEHFDTAIKSLLEEARSREWEPSADTVALWRGILEALFDSYRLVWVSSLGAPQ